MKLDLTTGDAITPGEIEYTYPCIFSKEDIKIMAYPLETILAEKYETIIRRNITTTRMRDFYDLYTLYKLKKDESDYEILKEAVERPSKKRASLRDIKMGLEKDKIVNGAGNKKWHVLNLNQILTNEKYMGDDALLQKTYTVDFLNKKRVKNDGIAPQYYVENSHEDIIPKEIFMRLGEEIYTRANMVSGKGKRRIYSSKYALSSNVYCSKYGDIYRRIAWNNRGKKYTVWRCCTRVINGPDACYARTIKEENLQEAVVKVINQLISESRELKEIIKENIEKAITVMEVVR